MRKSDLKKLIDSSKELQKRASILEKLQDIENSSKEIKIMTENLPVRSRDLKFVNNTESLLSKHMLTAQYPMR